MREAALLRVAALAALLVALSPTPAPPPAAPPSSHPFLLLDKKSLPALRAKLAKPPFAARWAALLETANSFCKAPVAGFERVRDAQGICGATAFAYVLTGKPEFAERAKREALALLAAPAWHQPKDWNKGAELPTAEASQACALVYDWCFDALTAPERATFRDALLAKSTRVYLESIEKHHDFWVENPVSNWGGVVHGGCGLAALALSGEGAEFDRAAALARAHVNDFLKANRLADGEGLEGVMYARYGLVFAELFHAADVRLAPAPAAKADAGVADDANQKLAGYWDVYLHGPDQKYANFNDMSEETFAGLHGADPRQPEGGPSSELCALYEARVAGGDPLLLWAADQGGAPFFYEGNSPFWFLWRREAPPAGPLPALQPAVLFRGAGDAVFRSGPLWLALHAGFTSDRGHDQFDLGTFVLVANGERYVADPGYGAAATADHSTLVVDGKDHPANVRAKWLRCGAGKSFQYGAVDLSEAGAPALRRWIRHVVVVKQGAVVLVDETAGDAEVAWRLQTKLRVELDGEKRSARIVGEKGALAVVAAAPADVELTTGQGAATWLQGKRKGRGATTYVTVLVPTAGGASKAAGAPRVRWDAGVLEVGGDTLRFKPGEGLASVNDEPAAKIASAKERSLVPFRK